MFDRFSTCARLLIAGCLLSGWFWCQGPQVRADDPIRKLQTLAIENGKSDVGHWGPDPENYLGWSTHTSRLIPVYTFGTAGGGPGVDLSSYKGENSPYRSEDELKRLYGTIPAGTLNPEAEYLDQTNIADIQRAGLAQGKKYVFLVVFDGMDWQTTQAAAVHATGKVKYTSGRGTGLHFQDYTAQGTTQFGYMVTSPHSDRMQTDVNTQQVTPKETLPGGYNHVKAGPNPWTPGDDRLYVMGKSESGPAEHPYPDSAATATAMTTGVKTYNAAINVDPTGAPLITVAHVAQQQGYAVGAVSSVPVSHATPAAAYAHNVHRDDFQDLTRDMVGLPSVSHPERPLQGLDVVIGGGFGVNRNTDSGQGANFIPGNRYIADEDLQAIDVKNGGQYVVSVRTPDQPGGKQLLAHAQTAAETGRRLFAMYGVGQYSGHLPFRTANGDYQPAPGKTGKAEEYTPADLDENPTLAEMTSAAIHVLSQNPKGFWLMVEPGDVDWANHDNNLDTSIGAVYSGDDAVRTITDWVEQNSNWQESLLIVTADHGHYLVFDPEKLASLSCETPNAN
jgi:alkaline phosphatase